MFALSWHADIVYVLGFISFLDQRGEMMYFQLFLPDGLELLMLSFLILVANWPITAWYVLSIFWSPSHVWLVVSNSIMTLYINCLLILQTRHVNFWKDTVFLIDRLHQQNHNTCSESFKLQNYLASGHKSFHFLNGSAAESGNAGLSKLKRSLRYMSKKLFMAICTVQLEVQNTLRIQKLKRDTGKSRGGIS